MAVQDKNQEKLPAGGEYKAPALTRFGTIEAWTLGALDGIQISIVL